MSRLSRAGAWRGWSARERTRSAAASPGIRTTLDRRQNRDRPTDANMSSMTMSGQLPGVIYDTYIVE
jgi:hypothetical protein